MEGQKEHSETLDVMTVLKRPKRSAEPAREVSVCDLSKVPNPANHVRIRVTGVVEREFENFVLVDPVCPEDLRNVGIWLTYGGQEESGAIYCCPGEGERSSRPKTLILDGIELPLAANDTFRRFAELMNTEPKARVRATLVGTFFARKDDERGLGPGYGHFGHFSLLVIQQVEHFEQSQPSK
jgi:hypothetical protein